MIKITNEDNLDLMASYPDKYFELAIVDPEYGIKVNMNMGRRKNEKKKHVQKSWDNKVPSEYYFKELFRVSKNQIIWGGNCFDLPSSYGWIVWDKQISGKVEFSECELAWTSFNRSVKKFTYRIQDTTEARIHPTQKVVPLYKFCLDKYAKQGDKILDTHLGSGSIAIACHDYGFDLTACELDKDYYDAAVKRLKQHQSQTKLF